MRALIISFIALCSITLLASAASANSTTGNYVTSESGVVLMSGTGMPITVGTAIIEPDGPVGARSTSNEAGGDSDNPGNEGPGDRGRRDHGKGDHSAGNGKGHDKGRGNHSY